MYKLYDGSCGDGVMISVVVVGIQRGWLTCYSSRCGGCELTGVMVFVATDVTASVYMCTSYQLFLRKHRTLEWRGKRAQTVKIIVLVCYSSAINRHRQEM